MVVFCFSLRAFRLLSPVNFGRCTDRLLQFIAVLFSDLGYQFHPFFSDCSSRLFISMASSVPSVLVLGHSFIRRLRDDLRSHFDSRADDTFGLSDDAIVHLHGVGGLTVARLRRDLGMVSSLSPQVVILELGTNDLTRLRLEVAGSEIEDTFSVRVIGVCKVLPRVRAPFFNGAASILNQYLCGVLEPIPNVFCWRHRGFDNPSVHPYLPDGVHVNSFGQYCLYRSYRGAILKALRMLSS